MPSRLGPTFARLRLEQRPGLVTYTTAADPDIPRSSELLRALDRAGADVLEVGVPFSDPLADGPVIQRATERALAAGGSLRTALRLIAEVRPFVTAPRCSSTTRLITWSIPSKKLSRLRPYRSRTRPA